MGRSRNSRIWKDKNWDGGLIRDLKINVNHPRLFKVNWDCGYLIQSDQNNLIPPSPPPPPLVKCMYYHMHGVYQHWSGDKYPHTSDKDIEKHEKWCCKKSIIETLLIANYPQWSPFCFLRRIQYILVCTSYEAMVT